ncbi:MAG TPA: thiamine phosphate synthase [Conexibacter sp.]|jgi:thiamine-phosphate pyrophosphorylase
MASSGEQRRARIAAAQLYLVCDSDGDGRDLASFLDAALRGGVDVIQLRDKRGDDDLLLRTAPVFRAAADAHDALFILNDRPELVATTQADGVHVGQDDAPVAVARATVGSERLVGLSTHTRDQVDGATAVGAEGTIDYFAVGPVHATPTKPGRPAVGTELIAEAAEAPRPVPWFAIGGLDHANVAAVTAVGATRIVVVRAVTQAPDVEAATRALRRALEAGIAAA